MFPRLTEILTIEKMYRIPQYYMTASLPSYVTRIMAIPFLTLYRLRAQISTS